MTVPYTLETGSAPCLSLHGDWTLDNYSWLLAAAQPLPGSIDSLDARGMTAMDTAGATVLLNLLGTEQLGRLASDAIGLSDERKALLIAVGKSVATQKSGPTSPPRQFGDSLARLGAYVVKGSAEILQFLSFLGLALATLFRLLPRPDRWRFTALIAQMHQTGLNAVPIVMLLNFLVGAVVAFLGATVLREFGATIYTVDLVAYAFMRELGVLLAAILLAGRTASAFTAQLGSMKINEELDALKVQSLNPMELLVLPRMLALLLVLPLLAWLAAMAGMAGGAVVAVATLDVSLARFIGIVQEIPLRHLLLGLSKAPFFAVVIALIGCLEGFKVGGSAQSLGEHTTSSVVQSIFAVILLDAIAALYFMEMGW
ncbi:MAG: ABC transporter permease [Gammaproteobacteria bacterium]|nr:ABC transporter permease [Pseudomonadales bacterium]MCP5348880.1 ABC transporter permease [Pseudomonadales bacterium]